MAQDARLGRAQAGPLPEGPPPLVPSHWLSEVRTTRDVPSVTEPRIGRSRMTVALEDGHRWCARREDAQERRRRREPRPAAGLGQGDGHLNPVGHRRRGHLRVGGGGEASQPEGRSTEACTVGVVETLASIGAAMVAHARGQRVVGLENSRSLDGRGRRLAVADIEAQYRFDYPSPGTTPGGYALRPRQPAARCRLRRDRDPLPFEV